MVYLLEKQEGDFVFDGASLKHIAQEHGVPCYVYSANSIRNSYKKLRDALPDNMKVFYSMKANTNLSVIKILNKLGAGMEIASTGELAACKELNVDPSNIIFAGPGKGDEELREAIDYGIYSINVESLNELKRVNDIAKESEKVQRVNFRINPETELSGDVTMGGGPMKFGLDEERISEIPIAIKELENVALKGVHVFSATQLLAPEKVLENIRLALRIAKRCETFFEIEDIDIGTGLGIAYSKDDSEIDISSLRDKIFKLLEEFGFSEKNFIMETGRFLVGSSGIYVSEVLDTKESRDKKFVIVRGGINHFLRPALIGKNHEVISITSEESETEKVDIGGQLCTSLDFIAKNVELEKVEMGDLVGMLQAGAYGYSESMPLFLSHPLPKEILVDDGKSFVIRESMDAKDFMSKQRVI